MMRIKPHSTWLMIGDSITACGRIDPDSPQGLPADLGKGYVSLVDGLLAACYPSYQIQVLNQGIPGDTVRALRARWQTDVLDLKPDWLAVCIGINDVWQQFDGKHVGQLHVTLAEYERTLDALLMTTRSALQGLVLMAPYFVQPRSEPMRAMMDAYGTAVGRLAQKHQAIFVDTQAVFDRAVEQLPAATLTVDGAHLTIRGHMLLAQALLQSVDFEWSGT